MPVNYQDYTDEVEEYADVQSDNAIASWAELSLGEINVDLADLGPDFDLDMLGIKDFELEPADMLNKDEEKENKPKMVKCPGCGESFDASKNKSQD